MKITLQDKSGKKITFETLHEVTSFPSSKNETTLFCEEWLFVELTNTLGWFPTSESINKQKAR